VSDKIIKDKDPQAILDFGFDYEEWLDGDTITASAWAISGPDAVLVGTSPPATFNTISTTVWLSAGTVGESYVVTNHITTALGRQDDQCLYVVIKNC
jgi:hypothetical protein